MKYLKLFEQKDWWNGNNSSQDSNEEFPDFGEDTPMSNHNIRDYYDLVRRQNYFLFPQITTEDEGEREEHEDINFHIHYGNLGLLNFHIYEREGRIFMYCWENYFKADMDSSFDFSSEEDEYNEVELTKCTLEEIKEKIKYIIEVIGLPSNHIINNRGDKMPEVINNTYPI